MVWSCTWQRPISPHKKALPTVSGNTQFSGHSAHCQGCKIFLRNKSSVILWSTSWDKASCFENMLIVHRLLAQDRAMATARATGTARPPPPPPCPARPPRPCPCRPGATQERPVPSTSTPTGTFAPGSGQHPTPSTERTTRWDWFDALLSLIFSVKNYSFPSMSLIYTYAVVCEAKNHEMVAADHSLSLPWHS